MFHSKRTWGPPRKVNSPEELAELLTEHTWTLCSAFEHSGYLYLNDSLSEDGAQEFAVVKRTAKGFRQVESITFGWCDRGRAFALIREVSAGKFDGDGYPVTPRLDEAPGHRCGFCA